MDGLAGEKVEEKTVFIEMSFGLVLLVNRQNST